MRSRNSPLRRPVRARNSTARRTNGSGSARVACSSLVNAPSSRKRGSGSSRSGRSPENTSTAAGTSSPSHSVSRSKQVRRAPRCSARLILDSFPPRADGRAARCSL